MSRSPFAKVRLVGIDASTLGKIASALFGANSIERDLARSTLDALQHGGWAPFITTHHMQELLQHEDITKVQKRVELIRHFPVVGVSYSRAKLETGTVVDLHGLECAAMLDGIADYSQVIKEVRRRVIVFTAGPGLVKRSYDQWMFQRPLWLSQTLRNKEIASIAHAPQLREQGTVTDILNGKIAQRALIERRFAALSERLRGGLENHGDRTLGDPGQTSEQFIGEVHAAGLEAMANGRHPLLTHLEAVGLSIKDFPPETSLDELGTTLVIRNKMRVIANHLDLAIDALDTCALPPGLHLWKELNRIILKRERADGGDITDAYLCTFAPYLDAMEVDKRTLESLRQFKQKNPAWKPMFEGAFRLSGFGDLPRALESVSRGS